MKKTMIMILPLLIMGCSSVIEVEKKAEYKCGEQVINVEYLDDDSVIMRINGTRTVLASVEASSGYRYENIVAKMLFIEKKGKTILSINSHEYPLCREIVR